MISHRFARHILVSCMSIVLSMGAAIAACNEPLTLAIPDWRRGADVSVPERHGFVYDQKMWTAVLESVGCDVSWKFLPVKRLMSGIEQGEIDGAAPSLAAPGRTQFAQFSDAYRSIKIVGFVRSEDKDTFQITTVDDLRQKHVRIGFPLGGWYGHSLQAVIDDASAKENRALFSDSGAVMFAWLQNRRVDVLIAPKQLGEGYVTGHGLTGVVEALPAVLEQQHYRLMLRAIGTGLPDMAEVNKALAVFLASDANTALVRDLRENFVTR